MEEEYSKKLGGWRYWFIVGHTLRSSWLRFHLVVRDLLFVSVGLDRCLLIHWDFHLGCCRRFLHRHLRMQHLETRNRHLRVR